MTYYNVAFEEAQYRAVAAKAAKLYQERCPSSVIPLVQASVPDAYEYRYSNLLDPHASFGGVDWTPRGIRGTVVHNYTDINLYTQQLNLYFDLNERNKFGEGLIADKRAALVDKWAIDVDNACFHGPHTAAGPFEVNDNSDAVMAGYQMAEGLIGQLTSIEDIDGTDSTLNVKGDIWKAINTMIDGIPHPMRVEGPPMVMISDEYVAKEMFDPDRIYQDKVEGDMIREYIMGDKAPPSRKIGQYLVSNRILAEAADNTDGDSNDTTDTVGTDSRILLFVPDPRWCGRIISRGFSLVGEVSDALGTSQIYGWKGRAYWFNTDCAEYSEAIAWA